MENRYKGCLFGLAVGDALGAPVEFMGLQQIKKRYGEQGIKDFDRWGRFPAGFYTDDTQMSLATAAGCIYVKQRKSEKGLFQPVSAVYKSYLDWLQTQSDPEQVRAPGNTCLSALRSGRIGTVKKRINNNKGCGGVMRTAPAGLAYPPGRAFEEGIAFAAITHGHPSGYLPAGVLAEIIAQLIRGKPLMDALDLSIIPLLKYDGHRETLEGLDLARKLAASSVDTEECIRQIGEGWVGEEALAISIYCALKFSDDWSGGTLAAVNHSGDSDSTGSITGAILGTMLGVEAIPERWIRQVENAGGIEKIGMDMLRVFEWGQGETYDE